MAITGDEQELVDGVYGVATNVCRNAGRSRRRYRRALASIPRPSAEPDHADRVTVSLSGVQEHFSLRYGGDTCAQANHGC